MGNETDKKALKAQYKSRKVIGGVYGIRCAAENALWLRATTDLAGAENRFAFSVMTNLCPEPIMAKAWKTHGAAAFSLEILETLQKQESQTDREFAQDIDTLLALWAEKTNTQS